MPLSRRCLRVHLGRNSAIGSPDGAFGCPEASHTCPIFFLFAYVLAGTFHWYLRRAKWHQDSRCRRATANDVAARPRLCGGAQGRSTLYEFLGSKEVGRRKKKRGELPLGVS